MIEYGLPSIREVGLVAAVASFAVVTAGVYVARRMNGEAPVALKYGLTALWMYAALRLYSASSFTWGELMSDAGLFPLLRAAVLVWQTLILIVCMALVGYYWRRWRRSR